MSYLGRERFFANDDGMSLTGGTTGKNYRIGQALTVRLLETNPIAGGMLMEPVSDDESNNGVTPRRASLRRPTHGKREGAGKKQMRPTTKKSKSYKGRKKSTSRAGRRKAKKLEKPKGD